jgi:hypothetical protein
MIGVSVPWSCNTSTSGPLCACNNGWISTDNYTMTIDDCTLSLGSECVWDNITSLAISQASSDCNGGVSLPCSTSGR